jgi:hypothetical protein
MVSRIHEPVSDISSRSIPIPSGHCHGIPYSIAVVKSSSSGITGHGERDLRLETFSLHHGVNQLESRQ